MEGPLPKAPARQPADRRHVGEGESGGRRTGAGHGHALGWVVEGERPGRPGCMSVEGAGRLRSRREMSGTRTVLAAPCDVFHGLIRVCEPTSSVSACLGREKELSICPFDTRFRKRNGPFHICNGPPGPILTQACSQGVPMQVAVIAGKKTLAAAGDRCGLDPRAGAWQLSAAFEFQRSCNVSFASRMREATRRLCGEGELLRSSLV